MSRTLMLPVTNLGTTSATLVHCTSRDNFHHVSSSRDSKPRDDYCHVKTSRDNLNQSRDKHKKSYENHSSVATTTNIGPSGLKTGPTRLKTGPNAFLRSTINELNLRKDQQKKVVGFFNSGRVTGQIHSLIMDLTQKIYIINIKTIIIK